VPSDGVSAGCPNTVPVLTDLMKKNRAIVGMMILESIALFRGWPEKFYGTLTECALFFVRASKLC
jgi:hypothetical protein